MPHSKYLGLVLQQTISLAFKMNMLNNLKALHWDES